MAFYNVGTVAPSKQFGETFMEGLDPYLKAITQQILLDQYDPARREARDRDKALRELMGKESIPTDETEVVPPVYRIPQENDPQAQNMISQRMRDPLSSYERLTNGPEGELGASMAYKGFDSSTSAPIMRAPSYGEAQGMYKEQQMSPIERAMQMLIMGKTNAETGLIGTQSTNVASETANRQLLTAPTIRKLDSDTRVNLEGQLPNYQAQANRSNTESGLLPGQFASTSKVNDSVAALNDAQRLAIPEEQKLKRQQIFAQIDATGEARSAREQMFAATRQADINKGLKEVGTNSKLAVGKAWDGLGKISVHPQNRMASSIAPYVISTITESIGAANDTVGYAVMHKNTPGITMTGTLNQGLDGITQSFLNTKGYIQKAIDQGDTATALQYWKTFQGSISADVRALVPQGIAAMDAEVKQMIEGYKKPKAWYEVGQ